MSGKAKVMGAGLAGSTKSKVSVNGNSHGGDKKQGLVSSVGLIHWSSRNILINANGQNDRNMVFCINQLGGVGANKSMFRTAASYARKDGVKKNANSCMVL